MELISTLPDLINNINYLDSCLKSKNELEQTEAKLLIKKGTCFIKYISNGEIMFSPSRFSGYLNNSLLKHSNNDSKHGSTTNNRIKRILCRVASSNDKLENEYIKFCAKYDIIPNKTGSFGITRKYWDLDKVRIDVYGDIEVPEGKKKLKSHIIRERNPRIRLLAINQFIEKNKRLYCECCGFDFEKEYGEIGHYFIECHHTFPVHKMKANHKTVVEDIALLCSNCHRMIHRSPKWLTVEELKSIIAKQKIINTSTQK